ncbi:MAG: hypothetical protein MUF87_17865 [Anaerolineae bacterium]|jgi:hypothetical protein|nr:hypothetical protein [Anaerolineae bacterium]
MEAQILQQTLEQYGLVGLIVAFLIVGPGFTYLKVRQAQVQSEAKARELLSDLARHTLERAEQLEHRLQAALAQVAAAESEVQYLRIQLVEAKLQVEYLSEQVALLQAARSESEPLRALFKAAEG